MTKLYVHLELMDIMWQEKNQKKTSWNGSSCGVQERFRNKLRYIKTRIKDTLSYTVTNLPQDEKECGLQRQRMMRQTKPVTRINNYNKGGIEFTNNIYHAP